jgi:hypothetical protein
MPEKPLLIFPSPSVIGRYKLTSGPNKPFKSPTKQKQVERIQPMLDVLENALQQRRITLQSDVSGVEPEMVLVFETRGPVQDFFKAVRHIRELEWLGEMEKDFEPDELFSYENKEKQIRGKFFFILTNHQALRKILRLWSNYKYGHKFDRGTTKWRDLFSLLYDVRLWGVQDRISETGILEDWNFRIQNQEERIPFELELWFRKSPALREAAVAKIQDLIDQFDGEIISQSIIEPIAYHGLLIKAPIQIFNNLTEQTDIDFFKASDIMFLRPVGQCAVKLSDQIETIELPVQQEPGELSAPIVALFDGLPLQNHTILANRLTIDDPDNFAQGYLASARFHGTGMSSVIIHGDKTDNNLPIQSRLYVRPILKSTRTFRGDVELIPEEELIVDLIHRAVRRLFERDGDNDPIAPTIKIINLSVGDPFRIFDNTMSSWAKLLDWLSFKYKVLFIVSAGNCVDDLDYSHLNGPFSTLLATPNNLKSESLKIIYNNNRHRKIISPAESINAITAGASDFDSLTYQAPNNRVMLFTTASHPSPLSRMGLGFKRSIKPDVLAPGGRALFGQRAGQSILSWVEGFREPGIQTAAPSPNNSLSGTVYSNGTSNSAALLSHLSAKLHENFLESGFGNELTGNLFPLIAKSLLVHCASWDEHAAQEIINAIALQNGNQKDLVTRFLGYGNLTPDRIFECTDKRVTLIGYGSLAPEQAHLYNLPVPVAISGSTLWRSLTVTLAWFSPVNSLNQTYRQAKLWFDFPNKSHESILSISRKFYDNDTVNRGTVQHEIFDGQRASAFLEGTELPIRVNCKEDAPGMPKGQEITYVMAVTLEVHPSLRTDIYNDIRLRIRPRVPVR